MQAQYADIIIDISQSNVDKPFVYKIPDELQGKVRLGCVVKVPFGRGNSNRTGYVVGFRETPDFDPSKIKEIISVSERGLDVESRLIELAGWMKSFYGGTMINALKTVMPVKEKVRETKQRIETADFIPQFQPIENLEEDQKSVINRFIGDISSGMNKTYLLHGITGSGKTEVYIRMAEEVISRGRDVIVLVPEIALTYQTVARFSSYFQDSIAILNSKLSKGEKYREFKKIRDGETHIMIGPRSALFAPFPNLGLIIIDEEHDISYKSEMTPKYHAREVAIKRAELEGASVVLGSATPSIESYYKALNGQYELLSLEKRVSGATLPEVSVVDLREELKLGNRSIISQELYDRLKEAFDRKEQAMLFINRRGFNTFVSCRECGEVVKCPNCDVSLALHGSNKLMCHYCGFTMEMVKQCPKCSSKMIGGYGTGTEKLEMEVKRMFPDIKTIRMDRDTTSQKGAHGQIIEKFRNHKADCLIGTQMIVKGHDFPKVTVVGNILADLSLFDSDFESAERTFDLLTQAAGRAGRGDKSGNVILQTYQPEHYAIQCAAVQDYKGFYEYEIQYRSLLGLPPLYQMLGILLESEDEGYVTRMSDYLAEELRKISDDYKVSGPAQATIYRINNVYRKVIYLKALKYETLIQACNYADDIFINKKLEESNDMIEVQYDFNPMRLI